MREADEVLEIKAPNYPSKEVQNDYMDWLAEDIRSDPWVTLRFKKYMANPKRVPWKNKVQLERQYKFTFYTHMIIGGVLAYPLAIAFGRRMRTYQGGVPVVPYQRFIHDFPNVEPARAGRLAFRMGCLGFCAMAGFVFAKYTVHD